MRSRKTSAIVAGIAYFTAASLVEAAPAGQPSIAIKFAADQPGRNGGDSTVTGPAGFLNTVIWNNTTGGGATQTVTNLNRDLNGVGAPSGVSVSWDSSGNVWSSTGRGEENNAATGENADLMAGYLDTNADNPSDVIINNLTSLGAGPYTVYVYHNGGVQGRGGTYAINGATPPSQLAVDASTFTGIFQPGEDFSVFTLPAGTNSFSLVATPTVAPDNVRRAPINGIEVVAAPVPEPGPFCVLGLGGLGLLRRRRSAR
jgi:MYXO-CTERM domain-containing protein